MTRKFPASLKDPAEYLAGYLAFLLSGLRASIGISVRIIR